MYNPCHPGEILRKDFVKEYNLTVTELAKKLNTSRHHLSNILNEKVGISPVMAFKLSKAFGPAPEYWMNLQMQYDLAVAGQKVNLNDVEVIHKTA
jgi:antitoxin HigA-1